MKPIRLLAVLEATTMTGPAKNLLQFAELAREKRFEPPVEVTIATFRRPGDSDVFLKTAEKASVPVRVVAERGRFDLSVKTSLDALARQFAPDVLQTHAVKSHFLIRQTGLHRRFPWVAFHHGYTWPDLRARLYNLLDRWSLRAARQVVTVSGSYRDKLVGHGVPAERIAVIHNAIDPAWGSAPRASAAALRKALGIAEDLKDVLIVGRLSREKDHQTLLDAMDRIRRAGVIDMHLVIVGAGPELPRIENRIRDLGLASRVTLTGQVPTAEPYYGIADAAVLSSRNEGSPNALLEAMAARVPVVATMVGGIPEIVSDSSSALLVPPVESEAMAAALTAVLTDRGLAERLTRRARELIETRYSPESRVRRLCELYWMLMSLNRSN